MERNASGNDAIAGTPRGLKIPKVVVKFPDQMELRYTDNLEKTINYPGFKENWEQLQHKFPGITINRHFTTVKPETIKELMTKAQNISSKYTSTNLLNYFSVDVPPGTDPEELRSAMQSMRIFETVYVDYGPEIPPVINDADDPRSPNQGYLDAAPDGINARYAFARMDNAHGGGINFVDMEQGWNLGHEDLPAGITLISGVNMAYFYHGTGVLGEVSSVDNALGCVGIAPGCNTSVVSEWRTAASFNSAEAIISALTVMNPGDVLCSKHKKHYRALLTCQ